MSRCWCKFGLAVLVMILAWVQASWASVALTIIGAILAALGLTGACCCTALKKTGAASESQPPTEASG